MNKTRSISLGLLLIGITLTGTVYAADPATENTLNKIYNFVSNNGRSNYPNQDLANAIINYEAAARMNEYLLSQQMLYMSAPGLNWAVTAGAVIGGSSPAEDLAGLPPDKNKPSPWASNSITSNLNVQTTPDFSRLLSQSILMNMVGGLTVAPSVTFKDSNHAINLSSIHESAANLKSNYSTLLQPFFENQPSGADAANALNNINFGAIINNNNLAKANVTTDQSQQIIKMITNPFPYDGLDSSILDTFKRQMGNPLFRFNDSNVLTGDKQGEVVKQLIEMAMYTVSTSALSDLVARRTPANNQANTVMEVMDQYSQERFSNPQWYQSLGVASEPAILREIAHMQAYSMWVQYQQFKIAEQQMALLASMNAMFAKLNSALDAMNQQMASATAEAKKAAASAEEAAKAANQEQ